MFEKAIPTRGKIRRQSRAVPYRNKPALAVPCKMYAQLLRETSAPDDLLNFPQRQKEPSRFSKERDRNSLQYCLSAAVLNNFSVCSLQCP